MLSYEYSGSVYIAVYSITSTVIVICTNLTHFVIQLKLNKIHVSNVSHIIERTPLEISFRAFMGYPGLV